MDSPRYCDICNAYGDHHTDRHVVSTTQFTQDELIRRMASWLFNHDTAKPRVKRKKVKDGTYYAGAASLYKVVFDEDRSDLDEQTVAL